MSFGLFDHRDPHRPEARCETCRFFANSVDLEEQSPARCFYNPPSQDLRANVTWRGGWCSKYQHRHALQLAQEDSFRFAARLGDVSPEDASWLGIERPRSQSGTWSLETCGLPSSPPPDAPI